MVGLGMCMHMLSDSGVISFMLPRLCACMLLYSNHTTVGSSSFGYVFVVFCCKGSKQIVHRAGNSVGSIMAMELMVVKPFSIALNAVAPPHASMLMLQLLLLACVLGMVLGIAMMCACSTVWGKCHTTDPTSGSSTIRGAVALHKSAYDQQWQSTPDTHVVSAIEAARKFMNINIQASKAHNSKDAFETFEKFQELMNKTADELHELCAILKLPVGSHANKTTMCKMLSLHDIATSSQMKCIKLLGRMHNITIPLLSYSSISEAKIQIEALQALCEKIAAPQ